MRTLLVATCLALLGCPPGRMPDEDLALGKDLTGVDQAAVAPFAFLDLDTLYQDCMPPARPDPLLLKGRMTVRNQGGLDIGPITARDGLIFNKDGVQVATFQLEDLTLGMLPAGGSIENKIVEKRAGTLMPAMQCNAVPCNEAVRIEVLLTGTNIPAGSRAKSANYPVVCAS